MKSTKRGLRFIRRDVKKSMPAVERRVIDHQTDGVYAIPRDPNSPKVKVRALDMYCQKKGVRPEDLSPQEMEQFLVYPDRKKKALQNTIKKNGGALKKLSEN